ncbi:hypothetical protein WS57_26110 [Burkholderia pseudomultivorans]|nr:hypothetical protein WS57_26110 [Burkholderia pseudomultivorans]
MQSSRKQSERIDASIDGGISACNSRGNQLIESNLRPPAVIVGTESCDDCIQNIQIQSDQILLRRGLHHCIGQLAERHCAVQHRCARADRQIGENAPEFQIDLRQSLIVNGAQAEHIR